MPRALTPLRLLALAAALATQLAAQDLTVGGLLPCGPDGPDTPPQLAGKWKPAVPPEMDGATTPDFVFIQCAVDAAGKHRLNPRGTNPALVRLLTDSFKALKFSPARSAGKPVNSLVWLPLILNPASAATGRADATPRVLAAVPFIVEDALADELKPLPSPTWAVVRLDAAGAVQGATLESPLADKLAPTVAAGLAHWRFAPARRGGAPVAAELRMPFVFISERSLQPPKLPAGFPQVKPRLLKPVIPEYPSKMLRSGIVGVVQIDFIVNEQGVVENPVVAESNAPAFNGPAIAALLKWKFSPALADGKPVKTRMNMPVRFAIPEGEATRGAMTVTKGRPSKLPPELRVDVLPKPRGVIAPVYPWPLLQRRVNGNASALVAIDERGSVTAVKVTESAHPEFGLALTAALEASSFEPAMRNGRAVATFLKTEHEFAGFGITSRLPASDEAALRRELKEPGTIATPKELDAPVRPLSQRSPTAPLPAPGRPAEGRAVVELLIDETGSPRLPRIVSATDPAFGYAAVQAVNEWKFAPPLKGGRPVFVRVAIPFRFVAPPPPAAPAAATAP